MLILRVLLQKSASAEVRSVSKCGSSCERDSEECELSSVAVAHEACSRMTMGIGLAVECVGVAATAVARHGSGTRERAHGRRAATGDDAQ
jgi:hypothetical protein